MPEGFITDFAHNTDIMQKTDNAQRTLKDVIERIDWTIDWYRTQQQSFNKRQAEYTRLDGSIGALINLKHWLIGGQSHE